MLLRRYRRYFPSLTLLKVSKILPGNLACTLMNINLKFRAWKRKPRVQRRYPIGDIEPRAAFSASKKRGLSKMDNWNDSIGLERILINCIFLCQIFDKWGEVGKLTILQISVTSIHFKLYASIYIIKISWIVQFVFFFFFFLVNLNLKISLRLKYIKYILLIKRNLRILMIISHMKIYQIT